MYAETPIIAHAINSVKVGVSFDIKTYILHPSESTKGAFIPEGFNRTGDEGRRSFHPLWQVNEMNVATDNCAI